MEYLKVLIVLKSTIILSAYRYFAIGVHCWAVDTGEVDCMTVAKQIFCRVFTSVLIITDICSFRINGNHCITKHILSVW